MKADITVSFHAAKLGPLDRAGQGARPASSGSPRSAFRPGRPREPAGGVIRDEVLDARPPRRTNSTKFDSGEVLVIGGSRGLTGAVCMASEAAIRVGAGYATVAVPADLEPIFEVKLTEVMSRGFDAAPRAARQRAPPTRSSPPPSAPRRSCWARGSGATRTRSSSHGAVAHGVEAPLLIDADGLNAHAGRLELIAEREAPTVLTPHAGELGRLLGRESSEVDGHRLASRARGGRAERGDRRAEGGRHPDRRTASGSAISAGGSPGLATAGTGDVLSGTIGALLARGMEPFAAACAGVHAHQRAGRIAAERVGASESVIATDVIAALPAALMA